MNLSVIIPCFNGAHVIGDQLEALAKQSWSEAWEVIVVDNRSTDNLKETVAKFACRIENLRIVPAFEKQGQPYALNIGVKNAIGESVAFCDADDVVADGWVAAIGDALLKHPLVASRFDLGMLNLRVLADSWPQRQLASLQTYENPNFLPHVGGCGLGVRRDLLEKVGAFDETLPLLHDTDLCWRLQLQGVRLRFVHGALVHIRLRSTLWNTFKQAFGYGEFNVLLYKRYRACGMPPIAWSKGIRCWFRLLLMFFRFHRRSSRYNWVRKVGFRVGRLKGCLLHRTFAP